MTDGRPTVSVFMITYNHEPYIAQALDSILMQKVNFDLDIVIGEDHSTDRTAEIVKAYASKYPDKIKAVYQEKNLGSTRNFIETLRRCTGKYIAYLEGDDYWTDPLKLQKQADLLEKIPSISLVFHQAEIITPTGETFPIQLPIPRSNVLNTVDILWEHTIPSCSIMVRNDLGNFLAVLTENTDIISCDTLLALAASLSGDLYFLNESMGKHIKHPGGLTSSATMKNRALADLNTYRVLSAGYQLADRKKKKLLHPKLAIYALRLSKAAFEQKDWGNLVRYTLSGAWCLFSAPVEFIKQYGARKLKTLSRMCAAFLP
jgi:glycosyltransferase involved in cell wall biosynthesis